MAPDSQWIAAAGCNPFGSCPTIDLLESLQVLPLIPHAEPSAIVFRGALASSKFASIRQDTERPN